MPTYVDWLLDTMPPAGARLKADIAASLGLVFACIFNNGTGTTVTDLVSGASGTVNDCTWAADGLITKGTAGSYVSFADSAALRLNGDFGIICKYTQLSEVGAAPVLLSKGYGGVNAGFEIFGVSSTNYLNLKRNNITTSIAGIDTSANSWAYTYDADTSAWKWYKNGTSTGGTLAAPYPDNANATALTIGARGASTNPDNGKWEVLYFFNTTPSAPGVQWLASHPYTLPSGAAMFEVPVLYNIKAISNHYRRMRS